MKISITLFLVLTLFTCGTVAQNSTQEVRPGAVSFEKYLPLIGSKHFALVANHTSMLGQTHLLDTILKSGIDSEQIAKLFCPEHGFRGELGAGILVDDHTDPLTGIQVVSLYGSNKKPSEEQLSGVELVLFDLQDVGTRFYTYISTLHYAMEACAENGIPLVVLDRPNPNGAYVDGPLLEPEYASFVGKHAIPVVYGLTIGELAQMINGEGWLQGGIRCDLTVIPCENYTHRTPYSLPVRPSPNLGNDHAIKLYPSTCFFEGTVLSEGRGTAMPFETYGHPQLDGGFSFTPLSIPGVASKPKFKGQVCYGEDLRDFIPEEGWNRIHLEFLLRAYQNFPEKGAFFTPYFEKLAGTALLRKQIEEGWSEDQIRESWRPDLEAFKALKKQYLIYE